MNYLPCYGPSATSVSVTKAGLAGTDRRNGGSRTMGRGLGESRGSVQYASTWALATYRRTQFST